MYSTQMEQAEYGDRTCRLAGVRPLSEPVMEYG